jgi:hypothetical protein
MYPTRRSYLVPPPFFKRFRLAVSILVVASMKQVIVWLNGKARERVVEPGNTVRAGGQLIKTKGLNEAQIRPFVERSTARRRGVNLIVSYAHEDRKSLERFKVHLKPLERDGLIERWDDTRIEAGNTWDREIKKAIKLADVAVVLCSADYFASDYAMQVELPLLLAEEAARGLRIIPVILKSSHYLKTSGLSRFAAINAELKPLIDMTKGEQEALWAQLVETIERIARRAEHSRLSEESRPSNGTGGS